MREEIEKTKEYLDYIEEHFYNVQKAWRIIRERCEGKGFNFIDDDFLYFTLDAEIKGHDLSKLSKEEFVPYRRQFFPTVPEKKETEDRKKDFDAAWEHHKKHNTHHWENWTKIKNHENNYSSVYLVHNICDWMAMGMKFNDTALEYYERHKDKIIIPKWAEELMYKIFSCVYE